MNGEPVLNTCVGVLLQVPSDKIKYELGPQFEGLSDTNTTHNNFLLFYFLQTRPTRWTDFIGQGTVLPNDDKQCCSKR